MNSGRLRNLMGRLRRAVGPAGSGGLTDADLLRRWVAQRDEAAFEALLWRHAAAVLGVCRRVLGDAHEAEDAAQASFLALARKAGSIGRRQAVAAWLYTVAYRAALQARARRNRRGCCDLHDLDALPGRPAEDPTWRDLRPVLDEEVSRLPQKYRAVFVLCHVEGRTNEEAARELGCPVGTVLSRLARARQRLRDRLTRRGVTLTAGAFAAAWAAEAVAAVPGVLVRGAVQAAALAAAGKGLAGVVSTEAAALAEGVLKAMLLTKVKVGAVVVLTAALLGGGGGVLTYRTAAGEPGSSQGPAARGAEDRPAVAEARRLKDLLAEKEKEVQDLKDRLAELERKFRAEQDRMAEDLKALRAQAQAQKAQAQKARDAEMQARELAERRAAELAARRGAVDPLREGAGDRSGAYLNVAREDPSRAEKEEQARDEVEVLEAQVGTKRAHLHAAQLGLKVARGTMGGLDPKAQIEGAALAGQVEVKEAELKESEVRLAQAKRRLQKLQRSGEAPEAPQRQKVQQRAAELEKKLEALGKELEALRRELQGSAPARP
jgi:RNA polymerase sigma factor (sigma-70 family)